MVDAPDAGIYLLRALPAALDLICLGNNPHSLGYYKLEIQFYIYLVKNFPLGSEYFAAQATSVRPMFLVSKMT